MENEKGKNIILEYADEETNEIHYERIHDFEKSLYRNVYYIAFKQVENIIRFNALSQKKDYEKQGADSANMERIRKQVNNLICFVGGRGTGKTSAMLSFMEALKDYYYEKKENIFYLINDGESKHSNFSFLCLDHIDASLLENGEDLFEVILTMMYKKLVSLERAQYLKKENFDYRKQRILEQLEGLVAGIRNLKARKNEKLGFDEFSSYLGTIKSMSGSLALKEDFEKLVREYLEIIQFKKEGVYYSDGGSSVASSYLVITIDDIDLNLEYGYEMLEQIHRYMMIRNVIVLLFMDDIQMHKVCERHFWDLYKNNLNKKRALEWEEHILYISRQYMKKVIPIYRRIYMPRIEELKETLGIVQKDLKLNKTLEEQLKEAKNIKKFLLYGFAKKTFICFDICGAKQHFYEPKTIRGIVALCHLLESLYELNKPGEGTDSEEIISKFESNFPQITSDIYRRMVGEQLLGDAHQAFKWIQNQSLMARGEAACSILKKMLKKLPDKNLFHYQDNNGTNKYGYGELMKILYVFGRTDLKNKALVRCLLASFTVNYGRQFVLFKYGNKAQKESAGKILRGLLGTSVTGSWTNQMLPKVFFDTPQSDDNRSYSFGNIERAEVGSENFVYLLPAIFSKNKEEFAKELDISNQIRDFIEDLELLLMFFLDFEDKRGNRRKCGFKIRKPSQFYGKIKDQSSKENDLSQLEMEGSATFNLLGFVNALYNWDQYFKETDEAIYNCIIGYYKCGGTDNTDQGFEKKVQRIIKKHSLKNKYKKWNDRYQGFALPFYNLDMTYNVLKRSRNAYQNSGDCNQCVKSDQDMEEIWNLYARILKELEDEDKEYAEIKETDTEIGEWGKAFKESPFIKEYEKRLRNDASEFCISLNKIVENLCKSNADINEESEKDNISLLDRSN